MKTSEYLKKAWALIDAPEKHCQGTMATNEAGHAIPVTQSAACKFCSLGAGQRIRVMNDLPYSRLMLVIDYLKKAIDELFPDFGNTMLSYDDQEPSQVIWYFNDNRPYEDVKKVWMKAIEMAEAAECATV